MIPRTRDSHQPVPALVIIIAGLTPLFGSTFLQLLVLQQAARLLKELAGRRVLVFLAAASVVVIVIVVGSTGGAGAVTCAIAANILITSTAGPDTLRAEEIESLASVPKRTALRQCRRVKGGWKW